MNWYEDQSQFTNDTPLPFELQTYSGPKNVALVDVFAEGKTSQGWGEKTFMQNYLNGRFRPLDRISRASRKGLPFAIVMRSVRVIALDIDRHMDDGGSDGFESAAKLDLPPTLAQTSKSGKGRHLFYWTAAAWDDQHGYNDFSDVIGLVPGIDVRAVGCIYRHASQRWNKLKITRIPTSLYEMLERRMELKHVVLQNQGNVSRETVEIDEDELTIVHDSLLRELNRPIPPGRRNVSLFAIGSQMRTADFPDWEDVLVRRAQTLGLDRAEYMKIISNIKKYDS